MSAGLQNGDQVVSVNGKTADNFLDLFDPVNYIREGLTYGLVRDGKAMDLAIADSTRKTVLESRGELKLFSYRQDASIGYISDGSGAQEGGIQENDKIVSIDSNAVTFFDQISGMISSQKGGKVQITVEREGAKVALSVPVDTAGKLGVGPTQFGQYADAMVHKEYGFVESFPAGYKKGTNALLVNIIAFGEMFKGKLNPVKSVSGPIGIAKVFGATWNWQRFWQITGMLSFILAFMNLLPIPALDGGHVLFLLIEMVRRKPLPEKVMYYFQVVGMVMLFALMGFIIFIDFFNALF